MDSRTALCLDDVDPALGGAGYDMVSERSEDGNACRMLRVLSCLFCGHGWIDVLRSSKRRGGKDSLDGIG